MISTRVVLYNEDGRVPEETIGRPLTGARPYLRSLLKRPCIYECRVRSGSCQEDDPKRTPTLKRERIHVVEASVKVFASVRDD